MFNWSLRTKIITGLSASVVFVLLASISGIIGNGMYAFVIWSGGRLTNLIKSGWLPWIITLVILLACLGFAFFWWHRSRNALDTLNGICDLDDSLLRLLPSLIASGNQEVDMKRLLRELLRDATRPFAGHVHRASILLPDARREYLKIWAHHQIPDESVIRTQFYIGNEENRIRGVAGETFLDTQPRVAHFTQENPRWKCDLNCYIDFDKNRPYPPYRSFIAVPIIGVIPGPSSMLDVNCLGVLCFDSDNSTIFDSAEIQYLLQVFSRRIAAALLIYHQVSMNGSQLATGQIA